MKSSTDVSSFILALLISTESKLLLTEPLILAVHNTQRINHAIHSSLNGYESLDKGLALKNYSFCIFSQW